MHLLSALSSQGVDAIYFSVLLGNTDTNTVKQYVSLWRKELTEKKQDMSKKILKI